MYKKQLLRKIALFPAMAALVASLSSCGFQDITDLSLDKSDILYDVVINHPANVKNNAGEALGNSSVNVVPNKPTFIEETEPEFFVTVGDETTGKTKDISSYDYFANISGTPIKDLDAFKTEIAKLPHLLYLDMCDCGLSNEQMEELIAEFPFTKFVWMITMTSTNEARTLVWKCRTDALAFSTLHGYASDPRLNNPDGQQLKYCKDLVALDLGHNAVYDIDFLKEDPNIHILIMVDAYNRDRRCKFDDLSILKGEPNLMYLEFFVGGITDLSFLQYNKELVDLNISYNPISDSTYLYDLPNIERLYLESTYIPYDEFVKIQETYPDAQCEYYGSGSIDHGWRSHPRYFAMINMYRQNYWDDLFRTEKELEDVATFDLIRLNKKRYWGTITTGAEPDMEEITDYLTSRVDGIPTEEGECNFDGLGHPYVDFGDGRLLVYMNDGKYHWFYSNEVIARRMRNMLERGGIKLMNSLLSYDIDDPYVDWEEYDYLIRMLSR